MADREKIMSGLEGLAQDDWRQYHSDSEVQQIAMDALELLKEQEAAEPVEEFINGTNRHKYHCKRCGNIVGTILDDKHPIFPGVKLSIKHFCDVCGQAVKWK